MLITSDIPIDITIKDNAYYFIIVFGIIIFFIKFSKFILNNKEIDKIYILLNFAIIFLFGFIFSIDSYYAIKYNYSPNGTILSLANISIVLIHIGIILKGYKAVLKS